MAPPKSKELTSFWQQCGEMGLAWHRIKGHTVLKTAVQQLPPGLPAVLQGAVQALAFLGDVPLMNSAP